MVKDTVKCSFCGREKTETEILIAGISGHICDVCIQQAQLIAKEELQGHINEDIINRMNLIKPIDLKKHLDEYVIGQDDAKKVLSVSVYNHYKRITQETTDDDVEIEKSNVILVGETGTGKTLLARTIARILNVPFCIADATVLTEAGYVGEDVESILSRLLQAADFDAKVAEKGIVFIDEIDKISRKNDNPSITRDVSGEGVQQALLKLLEGSVVGVPPQGGRKHPEQKLVQIDTKNILFICGGAFDNIDKIILKRMDKRTIGYKGNSNDRELDKGVIKYISAQDLRSYGLIPELIGRLPVISYLNQLDKQALRRILTEPKNSIIKQYIKLFEMEDIDLTFDSNVIDFIVEKSIEFGVGARGLRSICETIMTDPMFELPSEKQTKNFKVTLKFAKSKINKSAISTLKVA